MSPAARPTTQSKAAQRPALSSCSFFSRTALELAATALHAHAMCLERHKYMCCHTAKLRPTGQQQQQQQWQYSYFDQKYCIAYTHPSVCVYIVIITAQMSFYCKYQHLLLEQIKIWEITGWRWPDRQRLINGHLLCPVVRSSLTYKISPQVQLIKK